MISVEECGGPISYEISNNVTYQYHISLY